MKKAGLLFPWRVCMRMPLLAGAAKRQSRLSLKIDCRSNRAGDLFLLSSSKQIATEIPKTRRFEKIFSARITLAMTLGTSLKEGAKDRDHASNGQSTIQGIRWYYFAQFVKSTSHDNKYESQNNRTGDTLVLKPGPDA